MILHDVVQGTEAWRQLRRWIPTASEFDRIVTPAKWEIAKGSEEYINELIANRCCGLPPEQFENYWMRRGKELEPVARDWLALALDEDVETVGFCTTDCGRIGCSPDGVVAGAGVEIKNLAPKNHVAALRADAVPAEHLPQVHGSMIVWEAQEWWFLSYCPGLPPLLKLVRADDRTRRLEDAVWSFVDRLEDAYQRITR